MSTRQIYDNTVQLEAPEDLGKTGYFPFSDYKNITIGNVLRAVKYEEKTLFDEIQMGLQYYNLRWSALFEKITDDNEILITAAYGSNEGIYLNAYIYVYGTKSPMHTVISCRTLNDDDHTMARAWQSAGDLYRFLNGRWK